MIEIRLKLYDNLPRPPSYLQSLYDNPDYREFANKAAILFSNGWGTRFTMRDAQGLMWNCNKESFGSISSMFPPSAR